MAIDGLSLLNVGITRDLVPAEVQLQAKEAGALRAAIKKIDETDKTKLDPNGKKEKEKQQKKQKEENDENDNNSQQTAISRLFEEISEPAKSDVQYNEKALKLCENKSEYKVIYNSHKEIVEIIHMKTGIIKETLSLEELKGFVMRVKNPLGIIVDRKA